MDSQADEILTFEELAVYLKVSKSTLYKLVQQGSIPGNKAGKSWRFHKQAVDEWLRVNPHHNRKRKNDKE